MGKVLCVTVILLSLACDAGITGEASGGRGEPPVLWPQPFRVAVTPYYPVESMEEEFGGLVRYLQSELKVRVELSRAASYGEYLEQIRSNHFEVGILSPLAYVKAKSANPELNLIGSKVVGGELAYEGYLVTRRGEEVDSLGALKGKSLGYVDRRSASGYLYPLAYFRGAGFEPDRFFGNVKFLGDHQAVLKALLKGEIDVAATFSGAFRSLANRAPGKAEKLEVIAKTGKIPYDGVCLSPGFSARQVKVLRTLFLNLGGESKLGRDIMGAPGEMNGFVSSVDSHYNEVRRVLELVEGSAHQP